MADLLLFDSGSDFDRNMDITLAKVFMGITDGRLVVAVDNWEGLAKEIMNRPRIDHLGLHFHSFSGGMLVGGDGREVSEQSVTKLFTKQTRVDKISFFGCHIGKAPTDMWTFANLFQAHEVSGYTWTIVWQPITWNFPRGTDAKGARDAMSPYKDLVIDSLPAPEIVVSWTRSQNHLHKAIVMYGSRDDSTVPNDKMPFTVADREHKALKDAEVRNIKPADTKQVQQDLILSPTPPFQKVIVNR
jgi:hypothetical protein